MNPIYVTFGLYLLMMVLVGMYFFKRSSGEVSEYLLGGRGIGKFVTAMSAQASDMSGWLLMGMPAAIYLMGYGSGAADFWCAIGLAVGTLANWVIVAPRLRIYSEKVRALSIVTYISNRFHAKSHWISIFGSLVTIFFFTIYAASGLVAAGKLFESMFGMPYNVAVLIGTVVILLYTFLGGYLAVCWTDFVQGWLMFIALVCVPMAVVMANPGIDFAAEISARNVRVFPDDWSTMALLGIISSFVWGIGYFGQPHILSRFMSISDHKELKPATWIAMIWVVISLFAAVVIGLIAIPIYNNLDPKEAEKIFIKFIEAYCNPWVGGIFLAAILAAIMSTIDSQLLVCSATLTEDCYKRVTHKDVSEKQLVNLSRIFVLVVTVVACMLALMDMQTIFALVKFAWGGFGAAFGPVILLSLYKRRMSRYSAFWGMIAGFAVMLIWYCAGLNKYMYEILPGFIANMIVIFVVDFLAPEKSPEILDEFDSVVSTLKEK